MSERIQALLQEVRRASQRAAEGERYGGPLGQRFPDAAARSLQSVQQEVAEEIAASLGRAGRRASEAIGLLQGLAARVHRESWTASELSALRAEFDLLRAQAEERLHYLVIQREALGLRKHDAVWQAYPIPAWPSGEPPRRAGG